MRDWYKIDMETVFTGTDEHGVRYLSEFLSDYESNFSDSANAACRKCLIQYYNKIIKYQTNKNMENSQTVFRLQAKFNGIQSSFGSSTVISNRNLTDEIAVDLIANHPHGVKLFDIIPDNIDELLQAASQSDQPTREKALNALTRTELNDIAEGLELVAKDYANKAEIIAAICDAEAVDQ